MRKNLVVIFGVLLLLPLLCLAQFTVTKAALIDVPFQFFAGEKLLPAGTYDIKETDTEGELNLTNTRTRESAMVQIFTRISPRPDAGVVFDRTGEKYYLSEVYLPGMDGFLFRGAPAKHTHVRVKTKSQ